MLDSEDSGCKAWFVMRDLTRPNAKFPAYRYFAEADFEVFTPMSERIAVRQGRKIRERVPFIHDLLFVHASREAVDTVVEKYPTVQYRYCRGGGYRNPMIVADDDMERFIRAASVNDHTKYFLPGELTADMCGRNIRIVGGPLDGYEGRLLTVRGSRMRHLLVELPNFLTLAVEVSPEYVRLL